MESFSILGPWVCKDIGIPMWYLYMYDWTDTRTYIIEATAIGRDLCHDPDPDKHRSGRAGGHKRSGKFLKFLEEVEKLKVAVSGSIN